MQFKNIGKIPDPERTLYASFPASTDEVLKTGSFPSKYFGLLFSWPTEPLVPNDVLTVAKHFVQSGAVYISSWGKNCELVHDIFDRAILELKPHLNGDQTILTTWLKDEPLDKVLWDFVNVAFPNTGYERECSAAVMVFLDQSEKKVLELIQKNKLLSQE